MKVTVIKKNKSGIVTANVNQFAIASYNTILPTHWEDYFEVWSRGVSDKFLLSDIKQIIIDNE